MIDRRELGRYASVTGLNLGQAEKDYLQTLMLFILYRKFGRELVFKGGTALKKCFGLDRFSQDIDFTSAIVKDFSKEILRGLKKFLIPATAEEKKDDSIKIRFKLKGPLYTGNSRTLCFVVVDISLRESVILEPLVKRIGWNHPEIPVFDVVVMQEPEILAEKVRAILTRTRARDIYDVFFLIEKGVRPRLDLINKKLEYYGLSFDYAEFNKRLKGAEKGWKRELSQLVNTLPPFKDVFEKVSIEFKSLDLFTAGNKYP